jgi:hypothetical protein
LEELFEKLTFDLDIAEYMRNETLSLALYIHEVCAYDEKRNKLQTDVFLHNRVLLDW